MQPDPHKWTENSLDIVVPAYKGRFLPALLRSLVEQTSQNFGVIVSDDASPESLQPRCAEFSERLRIRYVRFERNLGAADLAGHWNRSVALSCAQWVMVPGDDDILEKNCVQSFWSAANALRESEAVFSFGVRMVDEQDEHVLREVNPAEANSAREFLIRRMTREVVSVPAAYVFSRQLFDEVGGFVSFDRGWHTDDATVALFAARKGIRPIEDSFVRWRRSGINISPAMLRDGYRVARATIAFLCWIIANRVPLGLTDQDISIVADQLCWRLYSGFAHAPASAWLRATWETSTLLRAYTSRSLPRHIFRFIEARVRLRHIH